MTFAFHHHRHATVRAPTRSSPFTTLRWAIVGCAAFWAAVGFGVAHALGG